MNHFGYQRFNTWLTKQDKIDTTVLKRILQNPDLQENPDHPDIKQEISKKQPFCHKDLSILQNDGQEKLDILNILHTVSYLTGFAA